MKSSVHYIVSLIVLYCAVLSASNATLVRLNEIVAPRMSDAGLTRAEQDSIAAYVEKTFGAKYVSAVLTAFRAADSDGNSTISSNEWRIYFNAANTDPVTERIMLPMSDGVHLCTYVSRPSTNGRFPVILSRTPYRANFSTSALTFGYATVMQDMRGRFASEGSNMPFVGCGWEPYHDGLDTVNWIKAQPWCDGNIGTEGASAGGITQDLLAGTLPDVKAQVIRVAAASIYHHAAYVGGALRKDQLEKWLTGNKYDASSFDMYRENPYYGPFWHYLDSTLKHPLMNIPAIHIGGWFDTFVQGTIDSFAGRQYSGAAGARGTQKLVIGPWAHGGFRNNGKCGELSFRKAEFPSEYDTMHWFDHYLKGASNNAEALPAVRYYAMGDVDDVNAPGGWQSADAWPPWTNTQNYYLSARTIALSRPNEADAFDSIVFDPKDPCPTKGGKNLAQPAGPFDQRTLESRADMAVYTSPVLDKPLEATGRIRAVIYLSSSAIDTDVSVRLTDVYPDGRSMLIAEGMQRALLRESLEKPIPLVPEKVYRIEVDLWSVSVVFNKGHRIRIAVTSSNYPRFEKNPGTGRLWKDGDAFVTQTNRIYRDGTRCSMLVLPTR
ncbi:MAG: CocE/NonD family hydrolase [Spirochaetota bacterium]